MVIRGSTEKVTWKASVTELLMTWLMPPQQIKPEMAKSVATTERDSFFFRFFSAKS